MGKIGLSRNPYRERADFSSRVFAFFAANFPGSCYLAAAMVYFYFA